MSDDTPGTLLQILQLDGEEFVHACYRELLHRDADEVGLAHHINLLENGVSKASIVASISKSDEACLNNMATSRLAISARRKALTERRSAFWPIGSLVAPFVEKSLKSRLEQRRAALLAEVHSQPENAPPGVQLMVESKRVLEKAWREHISANRAAAERQPGRGNFNNLWFDLTTAFEWHGGVVGIVRAELEMACGLAKIYPNIRFSMQVDQGFAELDKHELQWLLNADNVADAYMHFFGRYKNASSSPQTISTVAPDVEGFFHPYEKGDAIIAVGWMDSQKERYFSRLKRELKDIYLFYLVYDIILLLGETRHFYDPVGSERFEGYVNWISHHCDMIFYGGQTAQIDTELLQKTKGWPTPPGLPVKFGTDIVKMRGSDADGSLLRSMGVTGEFIITVGSIEPRKNHETLYRAYLLALELTDGDLPQLVFIGKPMWRTNDMLELIARHPRLNGRLLCLTPTDMELAALYKNCRFTVLPSLYEGWSLTLPESLGQGKFCLCSDTPPLREIGQDLVDYVDTFDVRGWAEKLISYSKDDALLRSYEERIAGGWPNTKWSETAQMLLDGVVNHSQNHKPSVVRLSAEAQRVRTEPPVIWMDLTTSFLEWNGGISGIIRAELEFAKRLKAADPRTRFFAYQYGYDYFFEIDDSYLTWLFEADDLSIAYKSFRTFWDQHESAGTGYRNPFRPNGTIGPVPGHIAYLPSIPDHSVVFFAGVDANDTGMPTRTRKIQELTKHHSNVMLSHLIYDLTPILHPQFHLADTCNGFTAMFEQVSKHFDHIVYGGRTAERDGILVQEQKGWSVPISDFVEFGSDIQSQIGCAEPIADQEVLERLGVTSAFAISVGTIEPRKNHEVLYKAYLMMLKNGLLDQAFQLVFVGKRGWKSDDFLASLEQDDRVKGKILMLSPTDDELDVLYRHCKFTLLPSFYEGWSLTLPESLAYGKLCITSDVDPLRETGRGLVEYVHPLDTARWADRIAFYANNPSALSKAEARIRESWSPRSWKESSEMLLTALRRAHGSVFATVDEGLSPTATEQL